MRTILPAKAHSEKESTVLPGLAPSPTAPPPSIPCSAGAQYHQQQPTLRGKKKSCSLALPPPPPPHPLLTVYRLSSVSSRHSRSSVPSEHAAEGWECEWSGRTIQRPGWGRRAGAADLQEWVKKIERQGLGETNSQCGKGGISLTLRREVPSPHLPPARYCAPACTWESLSPTRPRIAACSPI